MCEKLIKNNVHTLFYFLLLFFIYIYVDQVNFKVSLNNSFQFELTKSYVVKTWKFSNLAWHYMPDVKGNGCLVGEFDYIENVIPDDIENILVDQEFDMNIMTVMVMRLLMKKANDKKNFIIQIYLFSSYYYILSSH